MLDPSSASDPIELFGAWFENAVQSGRALPESVALATANADGIPSVRIVLLKGVDERGFVFFTNYTSRKGRELEENPHASMCFHWAELERQIRISGPVNKIGDDESYAYFSTRPRGSRVGAWASKQSQPLDERTTLEARVEDAEARFEGGDVPLPPFWGGYRIAPHTIEFWQGRTDRLHDRLVFRRTETGWDRERLYP
ncbi:MAG: pyridoxamine 5'-phosphate oxidase [Gemmatimonadota bacterium]